MTSKGTLRRNTLCLAAVSTVLCNAALAAQPDNEKKEEHLYLSEQYLYDDNLFRNAESSGTDVIPGDPNATPREVSREDYVNRITLGVGNDFHMGQQTLRLKGRVFDARYQDNDYLDYTGGDASAAFDFHALTALSGRLSGSVRPHVGRLRQHAGHGSRHHRDHQLLGAGALGHRPALVGQCQRWSHRNRAWLERARERESASRRRSRQPRLRHAVVPFCSASSTATAKPTQQHARAAQRATHSEVLIPAGTGAESLVYGPLMHEWRPRIRRPQPSRSL